MGPFEPSFGIKFPFDSYIGVCGKYYMSLHGMKELAELERGMADSFLEYYEEESKKLEHIKSLINDYDKQNQGINIFIGNLIFPLSLELLTKF